MNNIHFKIIVPMYNVEKWIHTNIASIRSQEYEDFQCIIIDDLSSDKSAEIAADLIKEDERFKLIINKEKKYALQNIYEGIALSGPCDHDVIATVDGDDWLYTPEALGKLNSVYTQEHCYLTYGEFAYLNELNANILRPNGAHPFPDEVVAHNAFRRYPWISSHLRTFKHGLWKRIKKEDLQDEKGIFYRMGWDVAFMMPMLEMSGFRTRCITDILYVYNNENPINDSKVDVTLQLATDQEIRKKPLYSPVENF